MDIKKKGINMPRNASILRLLTTPFVQSITLRKSTSIPMKNNHSSGVGILMTFSSYGLMVLMN